ncbi:hypothetical protein ANCDUO_07455 [Ancylostoma duodenale]|uniref:G-protein coupled receptors family 1 profile domain-containing protein n=1 Tax=Ancylostoma duodenale TaxID=51022 RepID=A0A0C2GTD2_9BILA|nr:hypothetical protein ANCDUO_07455 [Ancylostoma duodenale]
MVFFRSITLTALKSEETYNIITKCILYTLVMFVIPFVTLIIVNWRIIVALKQSTRMRNRLSSQKSTQSTTRNVYCWLRDCLRLAPEPLIMKRSPVQQ